MERGCIKQQNHDHYNQHTIVIVNVHFIVIKLMASEPNYQTITFIPQQGAFALSPPPFLSQTTKITITSLTFKPNSNVVKENSH